MLFKSKPKLTLVCEGIPDAGLSSIFCSRTFYLIKASKTLVPIYPKDTAIDPETSSRARCTYLVGRGTGAEDESVRKVITGERRGVPRQSSEPEEEEKEE
jgi:hypothetical protein